MKKDIFIIANIVGIAATVIEVLFSTALKLLGQIKTPLYIFVGKLATGETPPVPWVTTSIGLFGHLAIGVVFAFVFILILQKWGNDYVYLKGLEYGIFTWVVHEILIPNIITSDITLRLSAKSQIPHAFTGIIWGLAAACVYKYLEKINYI